MQAMPMKREPYGTTSDGKPIEQFTLTNTKGVEMRCINYGCRLTNLFVPAPNGDVADILLGYDTLAQYEADTTFQGSFIGRYANRIEDAAFTLDGKRYHLPKNDGENYLHGSFHRQVFDAEVIGDNSVSFTMTSPDGEDGFPGEVWIGVTYTLTDDNELILDYRATARQDTHINLTNHSYFNLAGSGRGDIARHLLTLNATSFLEAKANLCPTGRVLEAAAAFDFSHEKPIGRDIDADDPQLKLAGGYDHCFILNKQRAGALSLAAIAKDPVSERTMHVYTTQPGLQLYTGNFLDAAVAGKGGVPLARRSGFCLETQHYPCSPSHPDFPQTLLEAGEKFHEITALRF